MTTPPLTSALNGLQQANRRLNTAARNIVEQTAREQNAFRQLQEGAFSSQQPRPNSTGGQRGQNTPNQGNGGNQGNAGQSDAVGALISGGTRYIPSLAEEVVQLKVASNAYKANAKLLSVADEILRTTIESLGGEGGDEDR